MNLYELEAMASEEHDNWDWDGCPGLAEVLPKLIAAAKALDDLLLRTNPLFPLDRVALARSRGIAHRAMVELHKEWKL